MKAVSYEQVINYIINCHDADKLHVINDLCWKNIRKETNALYEKIEKML